jgi:hypothetical protein
VIFAYDEAQNLSDHAEKEQFPLVERGMIYKNRLGRYSFAVPLLGRFIRRTYELPAEPSSL